MPHAKLKRPSQRRFEEILATNAIINCDLTPDDARRALIIYGPDVYALKANSVKSKPTIVPSFVPTSLPSYILQEHMDITLCTDFFYVQSQVFLYILSRKVKFHCIANVNDRSKNTMLKYIKAATQMYHERGFRVRHLVADLEFEPVKDDILPIRLETVAKDDHVGDIERNTRHIK